ncbi:WSC domain-containing protein [Xylariomycetidae sp. FL2044]|nr:WSC domain-containing protein [Xylariomycetidae sp. FL2044]
MWFNSGSSLLLLQAFHAVLFHNVWAQQFQGVPYDNQMTNIDGSEKAFWKITGRLAELPLNPIILTKGTLDMEGRTFTQLNYFSQNGRGERLNPLDVKRAVIMVHGLNRDPDTYMSTALSALANNPGPANFANTQIIVPMFPNGDDKNRGFPWNSSAPAGGDGSYSNALVWKGSGWMSGDNNQYPPLQIATSSYDCLDQIIQYFADKTLYPNLKQIVLAGHSAGAQALQRYAAVGKDLSSVLGDTRLTYWIGNPNSYLWLNSERPLDTSSCSIYDDWRDGLANYSPSYNTDLIKAGAAAVQANYQSKSIAYLRSLLDKGDTSSTCAPSTQGNNRDERFFNFIGYFPPTCQAPSDPACDTIDYMESGHDANAAFSSASGLARLFNDNFDGDLSRSPDFYCPRQVQGDSPLPDPNCNQVVQNTPSGSYNGMTYQGCWTDGVTRTLEFSAYSNPANTVDMCTSTCAAAGYPLAGMEFGLECYCGKIIPANARRVGDRGCSTPCPGDNSQRCGESSRLSIWGTTTPTQATPAIFPSSIGSYRFLGCYSDNNPSRALVSQSTTSSSMTNDICAAFCSGYQYFGTEYATECLCGDTITQGNIQQANADCSMLRSNLGSRRYGTVALSKSVTPARIASNMGRHKRFNTQSKWGYDIFEEIGDEGVKKIARDAAQENLVKFTV